MDRSQLILSPGSHPALRGPHWHLHTPSVRKEVPAGVPQSHLAPVRRASEPLVLGPPFSSDLNALLAEARMVWASEPHQEAWGWHLIAFVKPGAWGSPLSLSDERAP